MITSTSSERSTLIAKLGAKARGTPAEVKRDTNVLETFLSRAPLRILLISRTVTSPTPLF